VADIVRRWWKLRYCLIPYLVDQGKVATESGYPVLRALVLEHNDDPACWGIDDQFCCGSALLVAPLVAPGGVRDVYLPAGTWVDFWTGERLRGSRWLRGVASDLDHVPVYARAGEAIRVYPLPVRSTNDMDLAKAVELRFDSSYRGLANSVLQDVLRWPSA
jgi:alpha-D-xyloside xylohydrolase